jgi:hypothetical protein
VRGSPVVMINNLRVYGVCDRANHIQRILSNRINVLCNNVFDIQVYFNRVNRVYPQSKTKISYTMARLRRVWRYQKGHQNPYIEEEQKTQRSKEKGQKDKQRSTKHTFKTKDRVTRTPLKTGVKSGAPEG